MTIGWRRTLQPMFRPLARITLIVALLGATGCSLGPKMDLVAPAPDGQGFVEVESGQPFVPWGTNHYDPNIGWPPQVWKQFDADRLTQQFEIMQGLGVNCARVFLAAATFQPDVETVDEAALRKLDKLIKIARRTGIRLIVTGPGDWEGEPAYWEPDRFAGEEALKALENFWTVVGRRYQGDPTILAWDLLHEPSMPWALDSWMPLWTAWLKARYPSQADLKNAWGDELKANETLENIANPKDTAKQNNPRLHDWQLFRENLADRWVERQVRVLREVDPTHMITVGYIQWSYPVVRPSDPSLYSAFNPHRQAEWLDFISIHFYPFMGRPLGSSTSWKKNIEYLQTVLAYCHTGKPVVLQEYGWYGGGTPQGRAHLTEGQQGRWISAEVEASRRLAHGWLSWPFADTPEATDMSVYGGMVRYNLVNKLWAWYFRSYAAALPALPQPTPELPSFDFEPCLTAELDTMVDRHEEYAKLVKAALEKAGPIPEIEMVLPSKTEAETE